MNKVWVVLRSYWNGEHSVNTVHSVWSKKEEAEQFVKEQNKTIYSSYEDEYFIEEDSFEIR